MPDAWLADSPDEAGPHRPLLLGMGWFPSQPGGLNRYFRGLRGALGQGNGSPKAVVIGPAEDAPDGVAIAADVEASLPSRIRAVAREARKQRAGTSVVDAHFALYAAWPVLLGSLRGHPLVVHFQGPWACESQAVGRGRVNVMVKRAIETAVYRRADQVITLSTGFKQLLVQRYGVAPWKVTPIPPGVDLTQFRLPAASERQTVRARFGLEPGTPAVLTVRRLVPRMGIDVLLRAWHDVSGPETDQGTPVLLIGGTGPERERLEALVAELRLGNTVRFLGGLDEADLVAAYQAADLTVVPTVALEGFGLVVLESLACGTPVVATSVGGLPEALTGLDPDLLVPPGDACALAHRIKGAMSGTSPLPPREACRSHAERFSWVKVAEATRGVYRLAAGSKRRPRVLYLDHCAGLSGRKLALVRLLQALEGRVDAHVVLAEDGPLVNRLTGCGFSVEVLPMAAAARSLPRDQLRASRMAAASVGPTALYVGRLARLLRRYRPDIVHTNSLRSALYGAMAARLAGVPAVWHLRDRVATDSLPAAAIRLMRQATRLPSAIIANSAATLTALEEIAPELSVDRVVIHGVIPAVAEMREPAKRADRDPSALRVGMVGRLAPWKGQHLFLEAFARAFPAGSECAVLVGEPLLGQRAYKTSLVGQVAELGLEGRVEFRGLHPNVSEEFAQLDTLVHASVIPEPFGHAVVEGMLAGLAVIAADAGGPAEVVHHGVDGWLYPPGDVGALAQSLGRIAGDPQLRQRLGEAARLRAGDFSPEAIGPRVLEVYDRVLARRGASFERGSASFA